MNDGDGLLTASMLSELPSFSKLEACASGMLSISPSRSARSTASMVPYLMNWISSNTGFLPRKFSLRSMRTRRPRSNSVTTYGPLPTIGRGGWNDFVSCLIGSLP